MNGDEKNEDDGSDSGKDAESEEGEDNFGVYMLILENDSTPQKCQTFFGYYEQSIENALKQHEKGVSDISVQMCSTENFRYHPEWKTIDLLLQKNFARMSALQGVSQQSSNPHGCEKFA